MTANLKFQVNIFCKMFAQFTHFKCKSYSWYRLSLADTNTVHKNGIDPDTITVQVR